MKILTTAQMRQAEEECAKRGLPSSVLMENAGKAVAEETRRILGGIDKQSILVLVGPGNNGGDSLVAARYLHDWGAKVSVYLLSQRPPEDTNLRLVKERGIPCIEVGQDEAQSSLSALLSSANVVIDAIFGTGKVRLLSSVFAQALEKVSQARKKQPELRIIALDLPSGLNADTGAVDPATPYADNTITLGFPKVGLFHFPGVERVGRLSIVDIGFPAGLAEGVDKELIAAGLLKSLLPQRPLWANKGTFGKILVVVGSINYIGAAYLACNGAMRVGAGLVTLATAQRLQPILASKLTEVTYLPLPESSEGIIAPRAVGKIREQLSQYNVMLVGCGLGQSESVQMFLNALLFRMKLALPHLVLDADALNALAKIPNWWLRLIDDAILTPHPGEMARLAGLPVDTIQSDRIEIARRFALEWHKTIVLKGAYTVIAAPDGRVRVSPLANPGLASAGTGDVLAGAIAGLLAQDLSFFDAATCGVFLHGEAGERVRARLGDTGMLASDLLSELPLVIKELREKPNRPG